MASRTLPEVATPSRTRVRPGAAITVAMLGKIRARTATPPKNTGSLTMTSPAISGTVAVSRTLTRTADAVRSSGVSSSRPYRLVDSSTVVKVGDGLNQLAALFAEFTGASSGLLGDDDLEAAAALNCGAW